MFSIKCEVTCTYDDGTSRTCESDLHSAAAWFRGCMDGATPERGMEVRVNGICVLSGRTETPNRPGVRESSAKYVLPDGTYDQTKLYEAWACEK